MWCDKWRINITKIFEYIQENTPVLKKWRKMIKL